MSYTMICAIFNVLGIFSGKHISPAFIIAVPVIGIVISLCRKKKNFMLALAFLMFAVGAFSYRSASRNTLYEAFPERYITVTGTIASLPQTSSGEYKYKYILDPIEVNYLEESVKPSTLLHIRTKEAYEYGDIIEASGFLYEISGGDNQYDYDFSQSFKSKGIYNQLKARESVKIGEVSPFHPKYLMGKLKSLIFDKINTTYPGEEATIYTAILLGDKSQLSTGFKTKLLRTGLWQALYSPYIHIFLLSLIAGMFKISKKRNGILFTLLVIYALFNLGNPNIIKASVLLLSVIFCRVVLGYSNKSQQLSLLVLVMTLINPMLCFNRGFVLSVACTILLIIFYPAVFDALSKLLLKKRTRYSKPLSVLAVAVVLTGCAFPISAYLFNGTSMYSTIISTLMIPVFMLIYLLSLLYVPESLSGGSIPWLNNMISSILGFIESLPEYIEMLPFHYISSRTPKIYEIITIYLILWLIKALLTNRKRDDIFKGVSAITLSLMICCVASSQATGLEIYFINVGQGDSAVLHTPKDETILIDGGGAADYDTSGYNVGDRVLVPYLVSHGLNDIDYAIVTHFHRDHAEGVISAIKNLRVKNIVMPDSSKENPYRQAIESLASERDIEIIYAQKDGMISLESGLKMNFLAPDSIQMLSEEPNDTSIVIEIEYHNFRALFTSDTTDTVDSEYPRYVDILKVAHHGSDSASSKKDIDHICPKYAVISVGEDNTYNLPNDSVIENLESVNAKILRTDQLGDIRFNVKKNGKVTYETLRKE